MPVQAQQDTPLENSQRLLTFLDDIEAEIVEQIENLYGDEMTVVQAWYIGKLIGMFGPKRVSMALHNSRTKRDPVRYAYSSLIKHEYGKGKQYEPIEEVKYWQIDDDVDLWS